MAKECFVNDKMQTFWFKIGDDKNKGELTEDAVKSTAEQCGGKEPKFIDGPDGIKLGQIEFDKERAYDICMNIHMRIKWKIVNVTGPSDLKIK